MQNEARALIEKLSPEAISSQLKDEHSEVSQLVDDIVKFYIIQDQLHQKIEDLNEIKCTIESSTKTALANSSITTENKQIDEEISSRLEPTNIEFFVENPMNTIDEDKKNNKMSSSLEGTPGNRFESYLNDDGYSADNSESDLDSNTEELASIPDSSKNGSETTESKSYLSSLAALLSSVFSGSNKQENIEPAKNMNHEQSVMTFDASVKSENLLEEPPAFKQLQTMQKAEYTVIRNQLRRLRKDRNTKIAEFSANDENGIRNQIEALKDKDLDSVMNQLENPNPQTIHIERTVAEDKDAKSTELVELIKASDLNNSAIGIDTTDIPPAQGERLAIVMQTIDDIEIPIGYYVNLKFYGMGNTTKFIPLDDDFETVSNHFRVGAVSPLRGIMNNYSIKNEYTIFSIYWYRWAKDMVFIGSILTGFEYFINFLSSCYNFVAPYINTIVEVLGNVYSTLKNVAYSFWNLIRENIGKIMGVIGSIVLIGGIAAVITCLVLFAPYVGTVMGITLASLVALTMVIGACFAIYNRYSQPGASILGDIQTLIFGIEWSIRSCCKCSLSRCIQCEVKVWFVICIPAVILLMIGSYLQTSKNARHNNYAKDMTHTAKVAANQNKDATMKLYRAMKQNITAEELEKDLDAIELDYAEIENSPSKIAYEKENKWMIKIQEFLDNFIKGFPKALYASCLDLINKIYTNNWDSSNQKSSEDESNDSHDVQTDNTRHYDDCLRKGIASHQAKYIGNASAQVTSFNGAVYSSVSSSVSSVSSLFSSKQSPNDDENRPLLERDQQSDDSGTPANNTSWLGRIFGGNSNEPESSSGSFDSGRDTLVVSPIHGDNNLSETHTLGNGSV